MFSRVMSNWVYPRHKRYIRHCTHFGRNLPVWPSQRLWQSWRFRVPLLPVWKAYELSGLRFDEASISPSHTARNDPQIPRKQRLWVALDFRSDPIARRDVEMDEKRLRDLCSLLWSVSKVQTCKTLVLASRSHIFHSNSFPMTIELKTI
jgi:hypothetical protein